jgi:hypothetical protein
MLDVLIFCYAVAGIIAVFLIVVSAEPRKRDLPQPKKVPPMPPVKRPKSDDYEYCGSSAFEATNGNRKCKGCGYTRRMTVADMHWDTENNPRHNWLNFALSPPRKP